MQWKVFPTMILVFTGLNGCASIGPGTVARDRFDYILAISDSWKSQMLFNLVKLRYGIDDKDFASKRLFSFIMFRFTLTETGDKQGAPIITVPVG